MGDVIIDVVHDVKSMPLPLKNVLGASSSLFFRFVLIKKHLAEQIPLQPCKTTIAKAKLSLIIYKPGGPWSQCLSPVSVVLSGREPLTPPGRDTNPLHKFQLKVIFSTSLLEKATHTLKYCAHTCTQI